LVWPALALHNFLKTDFFGGALIWVVVSALRADSFEPQARRYSKLRHYLDFRGLDAARERA
jgi:hypothetical protein